MKEIIMLAVCLTWSCAPNTNYQTMFASAVNNIVISERVDTADCETGCIIVTGDSNTYYNDWSTALDMPICNYGVGGYGIINIVIQYQAIKNLAPRKIFIMIGTNNVVNQHNIDWQAFMNWYTYMAFLYKSLGCELYLLTILPCLPFWDTNNYNIDIANIIIQNVGIAQGVPVLDTHELFTNRWDCYRDYVHLNDSGFRIMIDAIKSYFD